MKEKITFNLSPSALNSYLSSELLFYYDYIAKMPPDSKVVQCYGIAGTLVHELLEDYANKKVEKKDIDAEFSKRWTKEGLDKMPSMNGKPLSHELYRRATKRGIRLLDNKYKDSRPEEKITFPLYEDENFKIGMKGLIDLPAYVDGELEICDWKTSGSVDAGEGFYRQGKYYCLLTYLKHGIVPKKMTFEYLKIGKEAAHSFTKEDLLEFHEYLKKIAKEITEKGTNIKNYSIGDIDSPFNAHLLKCAKEIERRENTNLIVANLRNNNLYFDALPKKMILALDNKYSFYVPGHQFSEKFKKRIWDGKKHVFKKHTLPYAMINDFQKLLIDFNTYYKTSYMLKIIDCRNEKITSKTYQTKFKDNDIDLRYYQEEAVNEALLKKIGILYLGTGAGKSIIAAEIIKKLNKRTLFLVNRVELVRQTKEVFEDYLGVEVGEMAEGNLDVSKQITVASIQTIYAILKRKDSTSKKLAIYLANVTLSIFDEAQNLADGGMYGVVQNHLVNNVYFLALTGSPWRNSQDTLLMNALCGFVIYRKTTKELEDEGFLCPTKCYFIEMGNYGFTGIDYNDEYERYIVTNEERNNKVIDLVKRYRKNKKILILTRRIEHARILGEKINNSFVITGSTDGKYRKEKFKTFKEEEGKVLIGSSKIFAAGVDIPALDIIINTTGHKSSVESIQIIGRVKRVSPDKKFGYFIDFNDRTKYLGESAIERRDILKKFGNEINEVNGVDDIKIDES